jgi:hypothetical protein
MALGILRACYVSWLHQDWSATLQSWCSQHTCNIPSVVCTAPPEDEQVMLKTCRGP